jgi:uncharacterized membrane protein YheB (UPF0754 family)
MNIVTTNTLETIEGINEAIEQNKKNKAMVAVLQELLRTKQREIALLAKKTSTKRFNTNEAILKSVFVAVRPYIHTDQYDCNATKAFNAVLEVLPITFTKELQKSFFSTSILHCAKSNMLKSKDTTESLNSYGNAVKQAMRLLPAINANDWDDWYLEVKEAKKRADNKGTETPADNKGTETPADKKIIITTRKNKK